MSTGGIVSIHNLWDDCMDVQRTRSHKIAKQKEINQRMSSQTDLLLVLQHTQQLLVTWELKKICQDLTAQMFFEPASRHNITNLL
jgi:hypothetical protein